MRRLGDSGSKERAAGKEAHLDFCSVIVRRGRPSRPVSSAGRWRFAWRGPVRPTTGPVPTFRHFREKRTTASASWMALTPPACLDRPTEGARGTPVDSLFPWTHAHRCARAALSAVPVAPSRFPKRAGNKHPNSSFLIMEFCCKEKRDSNPTGSGGNAAGGSLRGKAQPSSRRADCPRGQTDTHFFFKTETFRPPLTSTLRFPKFVCLFSLISGDIFFA